MDKHSKAEGRDDGRPWALEQLARRMECAAPHESEVSGLALTDLDAAAENAFRRGYALGAVSMAGEAREVAEEVAAAQREDRLEHGDREWNEGASEQAKADREKVGELIAPLLSTVAALSAVVDHLPPSTPPSRRREIEEAHKRARDAHRDLKKFAEGQFGSVGRFTHRG